MHSIYTILTATGLIWCLTGCSLDDPSSTVSQGDTQPPPQFDDAPYHYTGVIEIDPETTLLQADWQIEVDQPGTDQLVFMLNSALDDVGVEGEDVLGTRIETADFGGTEFNLITVDLRPLEEQSRTVAIRYSGELFAEPMETDINSISPEKIEFTVDSFWMPFDQRFSEDLTADVLFVIPGDWLGVSTGAITQEEGGYRLVLERAQLDIPVTFVQPDTPSVISDQYTIFDTRQGEYDFTALSEMAAYCTGYLDDRFGENEPLPNASIVIHDRQESGYSRGTLIALTDIGEEVDSSTLQFICHEFSHFWSSNGIAAGVENWLNESFAEYVALMAVRERNGEEAFIATLNRYRSLVEEAGDLPPIWVEGATERRPFLVNYRKGPVALAELEERVGREAFAEIVRRYMVERIGTTPDLLDVVEDVAGDEARSDFEDILAR